MSSVRSVAVYSTIAAGSFGVGFAKTRMQGSGPGLDLMLLGTPLVGGLIAAVGGPERSRSSSKGDIFVQVADFGTAVIYGAGGGILSAACEAAGVGAGYLFK